MLVELVRRREHFRWVVARHRVEMAAGATALLRMGGSGQDEAVLATVLPRTPCVDFELSGLAARFAPYRIATVRVGGPDGICSFEGLAFVVGPRLLRMGWPCRIEVTQRRRLARVAWPTRLRYRPYAFRGQPLNAGESFGSAQAVDFSGAGVGIVCDAALPAGMVVSMSFDDPPLAGLRPLAGLVRHARSERGRHFAGLELLVDDAAIYQRLMRFHERLLELRSA